MFKIRLVLFTLVALVVPSIACAAPGPEAPVEELIPALVASWGTWPVFAGLAIALLVRAWQMASASDVIGPYLDRVLWEKVPSRLRPLIALLAAGIPSVSAALMGGTWSDALKVLVTVWGSTAVFAEILRLAFGKSEATNAKDKGGTRIQYAVSVDTKDAEAALKRLESDALKAANAVRSAIESSKESAK